MNVLEFKDIDPAKGHAHDLEVLELAIRNLLPQEVSGEVLTLGNFRTVISGFLAGVFHDTLGSRFLDFLEKNQNCTTYCPSENSF